MTTEIIHILPFDIGCSFFEYEYNKRHPKNDFVKNLSLLCNNNGYEIIHETKPNHLLCVKITDNILCHILECGIGVFVFKGIQMPEMKSLPTKLDSNIACNLYYRKKI